MDKKELLETLESIREEFLKEDLDDLFVRGKLFCCKIIIDTIKHEFDE